MGSTSDNTNPSHNNPNDNNPENESNHDLNNREDSSSTDDEDNGEQNPIQPNVAAERKGKGRRKIRMEKIANETNLQVTFSKRRAGIFKKASELGTLCGAESGIVIFSPGNKAHSFGNPNVNSVADRFINNTPPPPANPGDPLLRACSNAIEQQRNQEIVELEGLVEEAKRRKREYKRKRRSGEGPPSMNELNYEQLAQMRRSVMAFHEEVGTIVQRHTAGAVNPPNVPVSNPGVRGPWIEPSGPSGGLPLMAPPNMQFGPSHHFGLYGNEGTMFTSQTPPPPPLMMPFGESSSTWPPRPPPLPSDGSSSAWPWPPPPLEGPSTWPRRLAIEGSSSTWPWSSPMPLEGSSLTWPETLSLGGSSSNWPPPPPPQPFDGSSTWPPPLSLGGGSSSWLSLPLPSLSIGESSSTPTPFNAGAGSSNAAIPPNFGVSGSNMPSFADFAQNNSIFGNFGYTMNYPPMAPPSSPDQFMFPYTYGNPNQDLVPYGAGTRSSDTEDEGSPRATQRNAGQNKSQGFNSDYGRGNY